MSPTLSLLLENEWRDRTVELMRDLASLSSQHRWHQRKIYKGIVSFKNVTVEMNVISEALFQLLQQAPKLE